MVTLSEDYKLDEVKRNKITKQQRDGYNTKLISSEQSSTSKSKCFQVSLSLDLTRFEHRVGCVSGAMQF